MGIAITDAAGNTVHVAGGAVARVSVNDILPDADGNITLTPPIIGAASNPNLLDNWYFTDPVNQRGQTAYNTSGYTIDRWSITGDFDVSLSNNGLTFTRKSGTTGFGYSYQQMEKLDLNDVYTFSVLSDANMYIVTGSLKNVNNINQITNFGAIKIEVNGSTQHVQGVCVLNSNCHIQAAKFELGTVQTLAHKEGDTWVLNDPPPNKALELAKCQRYYNVLNPFAFLDENSDGGRHEILLQFPEMRVTPTVTIVSTQTNSENLASRQVTKNSVIIGTSTWGKRTNSFVETVILDANL